MIFFHIKKIIICNYNQKSNISYTVWGEFLAGVSFHGICESYFDKVGSLLV